MNALLNALTSGKTGRKMRVMTLTRGEDGILWKDKGPIQESDVVILNGVIVKNRDGKNGAKIGGSIYIWGEESLIIP